MDQIAVIEKSLRGFVCGIFGFLPVIGCIPALYSVSCWISVCKRYGGQWNPAELYLRVGLLLSIIGLIGSVLIACAVLFAALS